MVYYNKYHNNPNAAIKINLPEPLLIHKIFQRLPITKIHKNKSTPMITLVSRQWRIWKSLSINPKIESPKKKSNKIDK